MSPRRRSRQAPSTTSWSRTPTGRTERCLWPGSRIFSTFLRRICSTISSRRSSRTESPSAPGSETTASRRRPCGSRWRCSSGKRSTVCCYVPTGCAGIFGDVPCSSPFASWIEQLAAQGITGGCGGGHYCPDSPVTREQMAVFLLKSGARLGVHAARLLGRIQRRGLPVPVRGLDRTARGGGGHGRLRRRELLPAERQHTGPDGGVLSEGSRAPVAVGASGCPVAKGTARRLARSRPRRPSGIGR